MQDKATIKVLSLIQPWATLIVLGEKLIETRSWKPKDFIGELHIHASNRVNKILCRMEPFKSILAKHGYNADNLPLGAIIGKCNVKSYCHTEELRTVISEQELAFGDFSDNRYGWILENFVKFDKPIKAKGKLNIWEYDKHQS